MAKRGNRGKYLFGNNPRSVDSNMNRTMPEIPEGIRQRKVKLNGDQFMEHINGLSYRLDTAMHNYAVDVAIRALTVFRRSFVEKKFYSADGKVWPQLSPNTIKKRIRRGTWPGNGILNEYGNLYASIQRKRTTTKGKRFVEGVFTSPDAFPNKRAYGGVHNNPSPGDTYGLIMGAVPVKQRQFMGFSTYIDSFEETYIDRYLFHSVFTVPKTKGETTFVNTNNRVY